MIIYLKKYLQQVEFNLPRSWDEISVEFWKELIDLKVDDFINIYDYKIELLYILLDKYNDDIELDIEELDIDEVIQILEDISWLFKEPTLEYKNEINNLRIKDIGRLSLGEFIDLEHFFKEGYIKNIELICAILYRKYRLDDWDNEIEEPYSYNIYKRGEIFLKNNISNVYGVLKYYIDWKNKFMETFSALFEDPDFDKIEDADKLPPQELKEIEDEIEKGKKISKFNWHLLVYKLGNGDITKMDAITNLPVNYIFTTLAMKKSLEL